MGPTDQQSAPAQPGAAEKCASCGASMAADQRYCLACGARRGAPRVPPAAQAEAAPPEAAAQSSRPADVSPLAAVIGIALLGGMLLIGVLIGRGDTSDDPAPAPTIQVGEGTGSTTTASTSDSGGGSGDAPAVVVSEWPAGTDGFTIQLSSLSKSSSTPDAVDSAKQDALDEGAPGASVLDSDLYPSLDPGDYVIYSGVYSSRKEASAALKGLSGSFPDASVIEVSGGGSSGSEEEVAPEDLGTTGSPEAEIPGIDVPSTDTPNGGVTEPEK